MNVVFSRGSIGMSPAAVEAVAWQLRFIMGRIGHRVRGVRVRVDDLNGTRGGIDKRCVLEADLIPRGRLIVDTSDSEVIVAVRRAARTLTRRVCARFEQSRDVCRRTRGKPWSGDDSTPDMAED